MKDFGTIQSYLANIYVFNVSNRSTRKRCDMCSKLTIKKGINKHMSMKLFLFFYQDFLSRAQTIHRTAGEGRGPSFILLYHFHPLMNIQTFICNFASEMTITYFQLQCLHLPETATRCEIYHRIIIWLIDLILIFVHLLVDLILAFSNGVRKYVQLTNFTDAFSLVYVPNSSPKCKGKK